MSWAAVIAGGAAIVGGVISSQGAKKAASTAAAGSDAATAEAARQFDIIRGDSLGRINIGNQAMNTLGSIYGYSPTVGSPFQPGPTAGATPVSFDPIKTTLPGGSLNIGGNLLKGSGILSKIHDPFASRHGDENRNLKAFAAESGVMQLPNGMLMLPDGSTFSQDRLKDVAGTWYGAVHAPDGNQQDWQARYTTLLGGLQKTPLPSAGNAGSGLTSDGVPNRMQTGSAGANPLTTPDYSAFYKSPDYTFRRDEGIRDIGNTFSASGGAKSGNALRALTEFNSNLAAGEFGNYFNRQAALAGIGQTATNTSANAGIASGQIVGNALQNSADARASGVAGSTNAIGTAFTGVGKTLGDYLTQRNSPYGYDPSGIGYFSPSVRRVG